MVFVRYRYNTMADETPDGEWKWRVIFETDGKFEEALGQRPIVNVPSFSREDEMPVVGRKYHMACHGTFGSKMTVPASSPPPTSRTTTAGAARIARSSLGALLARPS
jgi:hypothetical protein